MAATASPQYQHFVPQFLLRNFCHPYKPDGEGPRNRKSGGKRKYEKGMHPKDPVVRNLDLLADPPAIYEKPVRRILGEMNMYQDTSKPPEHQQHVEVMLSVLERRASEIFRKITKAFEQKEPGLWLTRCERDLIRKFLFLLKYRGMGFRHRFFHQAPEDYTEDDRELLREYMAAHDFKRPLDVWFHNIKTIIELDMDPEGDWVLDLRKRMYPDDAMWFVAHVGFYYMAICTPKNPDDEFILTDNSYNIFEGPNTFAEDIQTGEVGGLSNTPLHEFAPISPKLMIVLRSDCLPNPLEDMDEAVKEYRSFKRFLAVDMMYPFDVKSLLDDLPIEKARNSYTQVVDGRLTLVSGEDGKPRRDHRFCFRFFPVSSNHVHTINSILLDNAAPCTSVVFESQESFARTLEWYLTAPCTIGKILIDTNIDVKVRETTLKKLEKVSRDLGSTKETVFIKLPNDLMVDYEGFRLGHLERRREINSLLDDFSSRKPKRCAPRRKQCGNTKGGFPQTYRLLGMRPLVNGFAAWHLMSFAGGTLGTFMKDMDQAGKMWTLRVKIDSWTKGKVHESIRQRNRELLIDAYLQLPPRRVWLFIKFCRFSILGDQLEMKPDDEAWPVTSEDIVAQGKFHAQVSWTSHLKRPRIFVLITCSSPDHCPRSPRKTDVHCRNERH